MYGFSADSASQQSWGFAGIVQRGAARQWLDGSAIAMAAVAGFLLCAAWYYTILAGFYTLYCPVMYLMFFHQKLYRRIVDCLFALWELYPVALFQLCFKTNIHHFGDYVNPDESTIIIINHRMRVDWNYVWIALYHATQDPYQNETCVCKKPRNKRTKEPEYSFSNVLDVGGKSKIKFVLKDEIKNTPGLGWIMQLNFFLYVRRNWQEDQVGMAQFIEYHSSLSQALRLVLFPEGTDLSADNKRKGDRFADANNLPHYNYVMHPRTTGWAELCSRLRTSGLASVYDVTVAYDRPAQTELDLLRGNIPHHVYFLFKRYPIEDLPYEVDTLRTWLNDRWREKEESLRKFISNGSFIDDSLNQMVYENLPRSMQVAKVGFFFWTIVDLLFMYGILNSTIVQFWTLYHSLLFIFVTWYFGGFHNIQYKLLGNVRQ